MMTKKEKCDPKNFITEEEREQGRSWIILFNIFGVFNFRFFFLMGPYQLYFIDGLKLIKILFNLLNTFCQKFIYYKGSFY